MATISGGEILARALQAEGIDKVFAIADISYGAAMRGFDELGIRLVGPRHESAGVHMADAVTRVTGRPSVVMAGEGPGVANLVPGVVCAHIEGSPVVVIGTQRNRAVFSAVRRGKFQFTPQLDLFRPVTKFATQVHELQRIPEMTRQAFRAATTGKPGPVYLEICDDVLNELAELDSVELVPRDRSRVAPQGTDQSTLSAALAMLKEAKLPLLYVGGGVHRSQAHEQVAKLAEALDAPVLTSWAGRGAIPEDDARCVYFLGPASEPMRQAADVVLALGTSIPESDEFGRPPSWGEDQAWIHVDTDPEAIGVNRAVELGIVADVRVALEQLVAGLEGFKPPEREGMDRLLADGAAEHERMLSEPPDTTPLHPARLAAEVAEAVPPEAILCFDGGNTTLITFPMMQIRSRSFCWTSKFGHLGTGLPYAIGAKLAQPDAPVVLITGDSSLGFNLTEIETAVREQTPIVVVVNVDAAWGMEVAGLEMIYESPGDAPHTGVSQLRYDKVAETLGARGAFVDGPGQLGEAVAAALAADGPTVIHAETDAFENAHPALLDDVISLYAASY